MANEFDIDPRNKLGNAEWEEKDELALFVAALNGDPGAIARLRSMEGSSSDGREVELDALGREQLKSIIGSYR